MTSNRILGYLADIEESLRVQGTAEERFLNDQMMRIIGAQKKFMGQYYSEPQLIFHKSGMPSLASLRKDLESSEIEGLCEELPSFDANASCGDYTTTMRQYKPEELRTQNLFSLEENDAGLTLTVQEDHFIDGFDILSQTIPVASRRGVATYAMPYRRLSVDARTQYKVTTATTSVESQRAILPTHDGVANITAQYKFTFEDYNLPSIPGSFGAKKRYPKHWSTLVMAGHSKRVELLRGVHKTLITVMPEFTYGTGNQGVTIEQFEEKLAFANTRLETSYWRYDSTSISNILYYKDLSIGGLRFTLPYKNAPIPFLRFNSREKVELQLNLSGVLTPAQSAFVIRDIKQLGFQE